MRYEECAPHPRLSGFVQCYWTLVSEPGAASSGPERILPDGRMEVILHFADRFRRHLPGGSASRQPRVFLVGEIDAPFVIQPSGRVEVFGIRFRHGGAHPLLPGPASEWVKVSPDLEDLWGGWGREIAERVFEAGTFLRRAQVIDRMLLARLSADSPDPRLSAALRLILAGAPQCGVEAAAAAAEVTPRHLERLFLRRVGIGPKRLLRLRRFQAAARALGKPESGGLAEIALDAGYSDQPHLTREFREFAGITPAAYRSSRHPLVEIFDGASTGALP